MKVLKSPLLLLITSVLCISVGLHGYSQPVNDDYTGALSVPINSGPPVSATTVGATKSSQPAFNDSEEHHDDDVWFKFVAAGDDYTLGFGSYAAIRNREGFIEIFQADSEGKPGNRIRAQGYGLGMLFCTLTDLDEGTTYFIRIYTRGTEARADFSFILNTISAPSNDDCENALVLWDGDLPLGTLTLAGATESLPAGNCATGAANDAWFVVSPLRSGDFNLIAIGYDFDIIIDVYKGGCSNLQPVRCVNDVGSGQAENPLITNVNKGETYYIRVYRQSGDEPVSSGEYFIYAYGNALPVKLSSFEAVPGEAGGALLNWATTEEVNSSHFQIQHSTEGKEWINIGQLPAAQKIGSRKTYSFVHHKPHLFLLNYYRLEMVDLDGTSTFSDIVSWKGNATAFPEKPYKIYPNPVSDWLQLEVSHSGRPFTVHIVDARGAVKPVEVGVDNRIDVRHLVNGVYILKIDGKVGASRSYRFVVTRR